MQVPILTRLAFNWRNVASPSSGRTFPFSFSYNTELELICQDASLSVKQTLEDMYGSTLSEGYLAPGHAMTLSYTVEFARFVQDSLKQRVDRASLLEVGCGAGDLLRLMKEKGYTISAVDPSARAEAIGERENIRVIQSFYPDVDIEPQDVLIHNNVLEHAFDPMAFLRANYRDLKDGGMLIFAVPDCEPSIHMGDFSMALHQHMSYFDEVSLRRTLLASGFDVSAMQRSHYGGSLFVRAVKSRARLRRAGSKAKWDTFAIASRRLLDAFSEADFDGIYCPIRAMPYLAWINKTKGFRWFDDNPDLHGRYYEGFSSSIENREDLATRPVERLFIASPTFAERIAKDLEPLSLPRIESPRTLSQLSLCR